MYVKIDGRHTKGGSWKATESEKIVRSMHIMEDGISKKADLCFIPLVSSQLQFHPRKRS